MKSRSLSRTFLSRLRARRRSACVALLIVCLLFDMRLLFLFYRRLRSSIDQGVKPRSIIYAVIVHEVYFALG